MKRFAWTPAWEALLREHYPNVTAETIAQAIGTSARTVYAKAAALGLKKSEAFYASDLAKRIQRGNVREVVEWSKTQRGGKLLDWIRVYEEPAACSSSFGLCEGVEA